MYVIECCWINILVLCDSCIKLHYVMYVIISSTNNGEFWNQLVFPAVIIGLVLFAGLVAMIVCKSWLNSQLSKTDSGFTYHQLKEMHLAGTLKEEEYVAARNILLDVTQKTASNHKQTTQIPDKENTLDKNEC